MNITVTTTSNACSEAGENQRKVRQTGSEQQKIAPPLEQHEAHPCAPPPRDVLSAAQRSGHQHFEKHDDEDGEGAK